MRYKLRQTGPEVQAAIDKIIDLQEATPSKAGLLSASDKDKLDNVFNSPELVGTPTAPTAPQGTNTTQIATTEFVQNEVALMHQFTYQVVDQLPVASEDTMYIIYFVPSSNPKLANVKDEYITVRSDNGGSITYSWEQIGSTSVDLSPYVQGPQNATNLHVAVFDGATGKIVADGGATVEELKVTNRAFPVGWRTSGTMAQLIADINGDATAIKGKSYLSTVSYSDLPAGLQQAEMVVEIMDELAGLGKVILFTVTSSDTAPYHWEYTSAYGAAGEWRGFVEGAFIAMERGTSFADIKAALDAGREVLCMGPGGYAHLIHKTTNYISFATLPNSGYNGASRQATVDSNNNWTYSYVGFELVYDTTNKKLKKNYGDSTYYDVVTAVKIVEDGVATANLISQEDFDVIFN